MLRSGWLVVVLAVVSATAWAQPAAQPTAAVSVSTDKVISAVGTASHKVDELAAQRARLVAHYQEETTAIDHLKQEKASWRRDRELRASLADSTDTANQLAQVTAQLAVAQDALVKARRATVAAIDAELVSSNTGPRAQKLASIRVQVAAQLGPAPKKIVLPDTEISELADPEELEQQAAAIRDSEQQLQNQVIGLGRQAEELAKTADVRSQHQRATELAMRDDDQPHRDAQHSQTTHSDTGLSPSSGGGSGGEFTGDRTPTTTALDNEAVVLGDVIDHSTIESLVKASRSGDPGQRVEAAKRARDAVAARLEQLKKKRAEIEKRAKQLRQKP